MAGEEELQIFEKSRGYLPETVYDLDWKGFVRGVRRFLWDMATWG